MSLKSGLAAATSYFKADDERKEREYTQARRDSELSLLPDKAAADRSGYQLRGRQNTADEGLVDAKAANERKKLGLESMKTEAETARQPMEQAAEMNAAEIKKALSEYSVQDLPRAIAEKRRAGVFNDADASITAMGKLAELVDMGEEGQIISYMNAMNAIKGEGAAQIAKVGIRLDPATKSQAFVALDANGGVVKTIPQEHLLAVKNKLAKTELKTVNAGDSLVQFQGGQVTPVYTAPESAKSAAAKQGPLERDVGYLVNQHGMSKDQALAHLNSAKTMTREQFILKSVQDSLAMNKKPTIEEVTNFGTLYDSARQAPAASRTAPASDSPVPANLDPQIRSLLGLPNQ